MWAAIGVVVFFLIAWWSGEHHAERAKRIVENNRVERRKKWRDQERLIRNLKEEVSGLKKLIKRIKQ